MTLEAPEFIRRYSMHILPKGLVRIRHYGILSSTSKKQAAICIKQQLPLPKPLVRLRPQLKEYNPKQCPCCKEETMHRLLQFDRRGPPQHWVELAADLLYTLI
jgi:hypothetical protein